MAVQRYVEDAQCEEGWPRPALWYAPILGLRVFLSKRRHVPFASMGSTYCVNFVPKDCWIGVYYKRHYLNPASRNLRDNDIYVCLVPMWPLHIHFRESHSTYDYCHGTYSGMWGVTRRLVCWWHDGRLGNWLRWALRRRKHD